MHETFAGTLHEPEPEQLPSSVSLPPVHEAVPHVVLAGQSAQAPPVHVPVVPHDVEAVVAHEPWGLVPSGALLHVPSAPTLSAAVHAWQLPVHAVLQQTPSAQNPLVHWLTPEHAMPLACLALHTPEEQ